MSEHGQVLQHDVGPLRVLTLSRPGSLNGMDSDMLNQLDASVRAAVRDDAVRGILLTGDGEAFSAGGDPRELTGPDPASVARQWTHISMAVTSQLFHAAKPVLAAVDGPAVGAGFALALACDVVLASPTARFGPVFLRRAILPDHAALWFLPRAVGLLRAKELVFSGRIVEVDEARDIGLCTEVLPADGFSDEALRRARELAEGPTHALGAAKLAMNKGMEGDLWTVQTFEQLLQPMLFGSDDFREGFQAYADGRPPHFEGS